MVPVLLPLRGRERFVMRVLLSRGQRSIGNPPMVLFPATAGTSPELEEKAQQ